MHDLFLKVMLMIRKQNLGLHIAYTLLTCVYIVMSCSHDTRKPIESIIVKLAWYVMVDGGCWGGNATTNFSLEFIHGLAFNISWGEDIVLLPRLTFEVLLNLIVDSLTITDFIDLLLLKGMTSCCTHHPLHRSAPPPRQWHDLIILVNGCILLLTVLTPGIGHAVATRGRVMKLHISTLIYAWMPGIVCKIRHRSVCHHVLNL